jgi:hypothetical protein
MLEAKKLAIHRRPSNAGDLLASSRMVQNAAVVTMRWPRRRMKMGTESALVPGSHASTLEMLHAWERKLCDEVKASLL